MEKSSLRHGSPSLQHLQPPKSGNAKHPGGDHNHCGRRGCQWSLSANHTAPSKNLVLKPQKRSFPTAREVYGPSFFVSRKCSPKMRSVNKVHHVHPGHKCPRQVPPSKIKSFLTTR